MAVNFIVINTWFIMFSFQDCLKVFNSGEFSVDDDGQEVHCTLCGDGAEIIVSCDYCIKSFCNDCIERISGNGYMKYLLESKTTKFKCYVCDSQLLQPLQELCQELTEHLDRSRKAQLRPNKRKTKKIKGTKKEKVKEDVAEENIQKVDVGKDDAEKDDTEKDNIEQVCDEKENRNMEDQNNTEKAQDSESTKNEICDKEKKSMKRKSAITPAEVLEDDSDSCNEGNTPEVHTDDVMSESSLIDDLAQRKERGKEAKCKDRVPLNQTDPASGTNDALSEDSTEKRKVKMKKRVNLLAGYSSEEEKDVKERKSPPKKSPSSISSGNNSDSDLEGKDCKLKRKKKSKMASYSSDDSFSPDALQLELSSNSSCEEEGEMGVGLLNESSSEPVEYGIPNSHSYSDSSLSSDIEPMQRKKRKNPLKTLSSSNEDVSTYERPGRNRRSKRKRVRSPRCNEDSDDFMEVMPDKDRRLRKKKKGFKNSDESSDDFMKLEFKGPKRRRQVVKNFLTSESESESEGSEREEEDGEEDEDDLNESQDPKGKKRKKIRKLIGDTKLASETKQALQEEKDRMERLKQRKKLAAGEMEDRLILEQDSQTKEVKLEVRRTLVPKILPHQREGIKFLYDSCVESLERVAAGRGTGAILAHCMGLGKTLQVFPIVCCSAVLV